MSIKHNFPHPCGSCTIALHIYEVKTHPRPEKILFSTLCGRRKTCARKTMRSASAS
jgi:hypothetical protein